MPREMDERARWYPSPPPALDGEDAGAYTDRLTGADGTNRRPYDHPRGRQCSIGYHTECTGGPCQCPHHADKAPPDVQQLPSWLRAGAEVLAPLYDLPEATGLCVLALAYIAAARNDAPDRIILTASLERAYASPQSEHFVTDVMTVYARAHAGTLKTGGIPGGGRSLPSVS